MRNFLFLLAAASLSSPSLAQTAPDQAAPGQVSSTLGGPAVAGVCLLSRQAVYSNAKVGKAAVERLRALADEVRQELDAERAPIDADLQKYNEEQAKLTDAQRQARQKAITERMRPVEEKTALRQREIEATRAKVTERIASEFEALVAKEYKQRNCGLLVDRNSVLGGNLTNDITQPVINALDAKMTTISFDREHLAAAEVAGRTAGSN